MQHFHTKTGEYIEREGEDVSEQQKDYLTCHGSEVEVVKRRVGDFSGNGRTLFKVRGKEQGRPH